MYSNEDPALLKIKYIALLLFLSHQVMSNSLQVHGQQCTRLLCPHYLLEFSHIHV